ncbi:MAG: DUF6048 family protein [Nonlabens sp.]
MLKYITSLIILCSCICWGQEQQPETIVQDSLVNQKKYGLRLGLDAGNLIRTIIDDRYVGFQILADYRFTDDIYFAGEIGNETFDESLERVDFKTSGSFIKGGIDYNFYDNWLDMDNMIYAGLRAGYANMRQELNHYRINTDNTYFPSRNVFSNEEFKGLNAFWLEIQLGIKVEVLNNLYLLANLQLRRMVSENLPDGFDNLYVPGYGRTYDNGEVGAGYGYGIMYRIPLYKK